LLQTFFHNLLKMSENSNLEVSNSPQDIEDVDIEICDVNDENKSAEEPVEEESVQLPQVCSYHNSVI